MSCYTMNCISVDDANTAYAAGVRKARMLRERACTARWIADALDGAFISKRLDAKLHALLPDMGTACITRETFNPRKYAYIHGTGWDWRDSWHIDLHASDDNRVNGELIRKDADRNDEEAAQVETTLARFTEIVGTYNALATAYAGIYDDLALFFSEIVYADYSKRARR